MNKVCYFLGAGFSAPLGVPVMGNFLAKAKDLHFSDRKKFGYFDSVLKKIRNLSVIKNFFDCDLFNIEEVLSLAEMQSQLRGEETDSDLFRFVIDVVSAYTPDPDYIKKDPMDSSGWWRHIFGRGELDKEYGCFVANLLNLHIRDTCGRSPVRNPGRFLFTTQQTRSQSAYAVVSLNYDRVLERHVDFLRRNHDEVDTLLSWSRAPEHDGEERGEGVPLLKLHGSVEDQRVVLPTWSKGINDRIKNTWRTAFAELSEANHWRFIGFSLPDSDAYVKYLLKTAVSQADHLKRIDVLCLDPDEQVRRRFDEFISFRDYRFVNAPVEEYLRALGDEQWQRSELDSSRFAMRFNALEDVHETWFADRFMT